MLAGFDLDFSSPAKKLTKETMSLGSNPKLPWEEAVGSSLDTAAASPEASGAEAGLLLVKMDQFQDSRNG